VQWGFENALQKFVGMFGLVVLDTQKQILYIARDRIGEKPLYYSLQNSKFIFGSELKAFANIAGLDQTIDFEALALLLQYGYVPAPYSIYKGINKLLPGHYLKIDLNKSQRGTSPEITCYWSMDDVAIKGQKNIFQGTDGEAVDLLEEQLISIINNQMVADVPVGAFLSGGIDSSLIVALMQKQNINPIKTFSIGFKEKKYNESNFAKIIARYIGTDHTELILQDKDAINIIAKLPFIYCEPFGDSSQIPTYIVSGLAKEKVSVVLTGDGGDELFCGYQWYNKITRYYKLNKLLPVIFKKYIHAASQWTENNFLNHNGSSIPGNLRGGELFKEILKPLHALSSINLTTAHSYYMANWKREEIISLINHNFRDYFVNFNNRGPFLNDKHQIMCNDLQSYLSNDILVKIDRAAMSVSLETRIPFLDHHLIEFIWQLPIRLKSRNGNSKWILKEILSRHLPRTYFERPKHGFSIPLAKWLRGQLREWGEDMLNEPRLRQEGYFDPVIVRKAWQEHLSGKVNWANKLWIILMFQAWIDSKQK
jgi:asparagine synthase (glutamine-hydrolysing)